MTTKRNYLTDEARLIAKKASAGRKTLLAELRSYVTDSAVKRANVGPDSTAGFEQSFASIAFTYIQEKAPSLVDYMIGFQLVDRAEDNQRAVGIFGFKVGDQWAYVPVFFLNGNLKGHELFYLKNQDTFVPLKENWVNYILNKKPQILGQGTHETDQQLGIMQPNMSRLSQPPIHGKFGMYVPPKLKSWAKEAMVKIAGWATKSPGEEKLDFAKFINNDVRLVKLAIDAYNKYPGIKNAVDDLYGKDLFARVLTDMKDRVIKESRVSLMDRKEQEAVKKPTQRKSILDEKVAVADEPKKVEIVPDAVITDNMPEMTEAEQERLLRDGYLVKDRRAGEEVSVAYNTQVEMALVNPDATDVYDVLVKPEGFKRCLVIHNPHNGRGRKSSAVVIELGDGDKNWENIHQTKLFVKQQERGKSDIEEYHDWFDKLSNSKDSMAKNGTYVILTQNGSGTCVFQVREDLGDGCYRVSWEDWGGDTKAEYLPDSDQMRLGSSVCCGCDDIIYFNQREGVRFKSINGKLYIPPDAKVMKVRDPDKCKDCSKVDEDCTCDYFHRNYDLGNKPINPGNLADLQLQIMQKTAELKVWTDNNEIVVNRRRMSKKAGLFHLIIHHGLREKQAKRIIKEAERFGGARFRIKYADPYSAMQGPGAPSIPPADYGSMDLPYSSVMSMEGPQTSFESVPELSAGNTDPSVYDPMQYMDPQAMQIAQEGQQQGQKDIFDTSMIAAMLKAVRDDSMVDRYLGDLVKALDRIGRIMFMFFWHNEEFAGRYGKQDLPQLEDTLANSFEVLGDLVLYLKQKSITSDLSAMDMRPDGG